ncbi:ATP synthase F1 subunit gamma [Collinsella sp. AGMB00827]|uniref:ATP synthase gamma chain n=1 Tax=Collinsella ureilytica TaxID=2869515 RepID=A0ABS7MKI5_9ACTN|nr:ATP synthase F1 subunit gamma [Collinsella urealyticum]MBY4797586.1 ATP synthase F1 subunit gamma [Collinsella urealyticum]
MANLRDIKKRISSVSTTEQITRTMEMVSTAKIARALAREKRSEPYRAAITDVMLTVAGDASSSSPLLKNPEHYERALLVVINSDRGLAAGFNTQVQRAAERRIDHYRRHGASEVELITCGRKATEHFQDHPNLVMSVTGESDSPTLQRAREIADYIIDGFGTGRFGRVDIVYFHAKNRVEQVLRQERILPLDPDVLAAPRGPRTDDKGGPRRINLPFTYAPSADHVLDRLIPSYVLTVVHQALIDSAAAEHGARRKAMHSATENASAIIADLNRTYNRVRQASITTELNEIVGGAAALEDY